MNRLAPVTLILCLLFGSAQAQEAEVRQLVDAFVVALENLDWDAFRKCWSDNPVLYSPTDTLRREGPVFESEWQAQFQQLRQAAAARGVTKPPYLRVDPKDLRIDFPTLNSAVVTFHLTDANRPRRRMLVVAKNPAGWKITHLNNSDIAVR